MSTKDTKTIGDSLEDTKEYHRRYLRAINSPLRRKILKILESGDATIKELAFPTGLDEKTLKWHLDILEYGFCVEKNVKNDEIFYKITEDGKVIEHIEE